MTTSESNGEWRSLIDARLDQIERVLLRVDVSYSERRHIVGEVETQIFELLARRSENPTREDVQAVLDSLDPAEAYIPEEFRGKVRESALEPRLVRPRGPRVSRLAIGSAVLSALIVVWAVLLAVFDPHDFGQGMIVLGIALLIPMGLGIIASARIVLSDGRLRGLPLAFFAAGMFPLIAVNLLAFVILVATEWFVPVLLTIAGVLYLNYLGIRRVWRWFSDRQPQLAALLRGTFPGSHMFGTPVA